ncbi:MAG: hypothetical protein H6551_13300 [Chitinophagales bacterium]|nr:hypothetical protein [Chitinophagaceae bacterium]MCB9066109.1 hypothetical protein [Chitinophagales bacterium]
MGHNTGHSNENNTKTPSRSSYWFMFILAGVFIAAVNFVSVMSHDEGGHDEGHGTEMHATDENHGDGGHADQEHHEEANHEEAHH